jgi:hypothetical protein
MARQDLQNRRTVDRDQIGYAIVVVSAWTAVILALFLR